MRRRPDFAQLLDQALRDSEEPIAPPPARQPGSARPAPPHPFLFTAPFRIVHSAPVETRIGHVESAAGVCPPLEVNIPPLREEAPRVRLTSAGRPVCARPAPPAVPPRRALTAREVEALDAFNRLGARLTSNFTVRELRTAYRLLARQLHPDANTSADAGDRAQRARLFVTATEHHRTLVQVFRRDAPRAA